MSKILYFSIPAHGHVNPALPVVRELVRRGERVLFYNTEEFRPQSERAGAIFRAYPDSRLTASQIAGRLQDGNLAGVSVLFLHTTEDLLPFTMKEVAQEEPDLIMFDQSAMWARMAATLAQRPAAVTLPTLVFEGTKEARLPPRAWLQVIRWLPLVKAIAGARFRLSRKYGAEAFPPMPPLFPMRGDLNISFTSRDLHPDSPLIDETFRFVGPSIDPFIRDEVFPFDALGQGAPVYISLGTIHSAGGDFYRRCFQAFGDYPAQFILSAGKETDIEALGTIPANFIVRPSVPQLEVLERASAFISHSGMNSVHEALYYGVPLLLIPHQLEQLFTARTVAARGAAIVLEEQATGRQVATATLRRSLEELLSSPGYREAAGKLQNSLRATGGYSQAADEIQAYLSKRRSTE